MSVSVEALYERWERELAQMRRPPDPVVIAALEFEAHEQGYDLLDIHRALIGAPFFDETLHPRGKDGKFIEKGGLVRLLNFKFRGKNGKEYDFHGQRGKVLGITPDKKSNKLPPDIRVGVLRPDQADTDTPSTIINVKPNNVEEAPEKGRLALPDAAPDERAELEGQIPEGVDEDAAALREGLRERVHKFNEALNRAADRLTEREGESSQGMTIEQQRIALTAQINEKAAELSTTDPEMRYQQLEEMMAPENGPGLRGAIIDTDQVHDHVDGKEDWYTPERYAQHEEIYQNLLAQVQDAGIPKSRDALVLGGLPGAGKTFSLRPGEAAADYDVVSWEPNGVNSPPDGVTHVSINPDAVKEMLIHNGMLPEGVTGLKPMEQATFIHEESSALSKMISRRFARAGFNIVLDNTMDKPGGMIKRMDPLAKNGYTFRALFADITPEESGISVKKRYIRSALTEEGGRFVPSSVMGNRSTDTGRMSANRDTFDTLAEQDWFTEWKVVDNTGVSNDPPSPKKDVTAQGTGDGSAAARRIIPKIEQQSTPLGGDNQTTISSDEAGSLATNVQSGRPVDVDPPNIDDIIDQFADSPEPVDLTLVSAFAGMRSAGIPRSQMPQISEEHQRAFQERLCAAQIGFAGDVVDPQDLSATQSELDGKSVSGIMRATRDGSFDLVNRPIWISNDNYVLDGHHRWGAAMALSTNCNPPEHDCVNMPVIRIDMPMSELLPFANAFNDEMGVERLSFGEAKLPGAVAAGTPPPGTSPDRWASVIPQPDADGFYTMKMASDTEDGIKDEDLANLSHGDGSAFGYQPKGPAEAEPDEELAE